MSDPFMSWSASESDETMITRSDALTLLGSFFRGDTPFEPTKELSGHASSGIPDIFCDWFDQLTEEDKRVVANVLVEAVIESGELDENLPQACFLMVEVATRCQASIPESAAARVEQVLRSSDSVRTWLNDVESDDDGRKNFRMRWRFALALWNFLWVMESPVADKLFEVFAAGAKDTHFARSIRLAKSVPPST
jgi:hypothetical protein